MAGSSTSRAGSGVAPGRSSPVRAATTIDAIENKTSSAWSTFASHRQIPTTLRIFPARAVHPSRGSQAAAQPPTTTRSCLPFIPGTRNSQAAPPIRICPVFLQIFQGLEDPRDSGRTKSGHRMPAPALHRRQSSFGVPGFSGSRWCGHLDRRAVECVAGQAAAATTGIASTPMFVMMSVSSIVGEEMVYG